MVNFTSFNGNMALTKNDLDKIDERVGTRLEAQKEEILEAVEDKLQTLKSEFFDRIDPILKEVVTAREERPLIVQRIEKLENDLQS